MLNNEFPPYFGLVHLSNTENDHWKVVLHIVEDHSFCEMACQVCQDERSEELEMERVKESCPQIYDEFIQLVENTILLSDRAEKSDVRMELTS